MYVCERHDDCIVVYNRTDCPVCRDEEESADRIRAAELRAEEADDDLADRSDELTATRQEVEALEGRLAAVEAPVVPKEERP